jgi:hypothetical protein
MPRSRRSRSPRRVPSGYELNPATNRLRKVCPPFKIRSPRGYCINIPRTPRRSPSPRRIPAGYELNPATNRLRKKCPVGKVRSPFGSYCVLRRRRRSRSRSPRRSTRIARQRRSRSPVRGSPKECCVCYENTNTAVQGCKHPVCKTCFKGMKRSGRTLACPMCRGNMRKLVKV